MPVVQPPRHSTDSSSEKPDPPRSALIIAAELDRRSTARQGATGRQRIVRGLFVVLLTFVAVVGWSIGTALAAPGSDSVPARLAEWSRDHGLGGVGTWLEQRQHAHNRPRVGGEPAGGVPPAGGALPTTPP
jgi:hypothetical protein